MFLRNWTEEMNVEKIYSLSRLIFFKANYSKERQRSRRNYIVTLYTVDKDMLRKRDI